MSEFKVKVGDRIEYADGDYVSQGVVDEIVNDECWVAFDSGELAGQRAYSTQPDWYFTVIEPAEVIDRTTDDDGEVIPELLALFERVGVAGEPDGVDEPTAEEYEEASRLFEKLLGTALEAKPVTTADTYGLEPSRIAALQIAAGVYGQTVVDSSHILNIARFLLDQEFVVGRVTA